MGRPSHFPTGTVRYVHVRGAELNGEDRIQDIERPDLRADQEGADLRRVPLRADPGHPKPGRDLRGLDDAGAALQRLVAERHLSLLPNHSIVVPLLDAERFVELFRIRRELEGLAGELAAPRFGRQNLARLDSVVEAIDKALAGSGGSYQALNQRFHFAIYERAGSPVLLTMIQNMWSQVGPFFNELTEDDSFVAKANDQHRAILAALRSKDTAAVRHHLSLDISVAADHLIPRLKRLEAKSDQPLSMRA